MIKPINFDVDSAVSESRLASNAARLINGYVGDDGALYRFPGYAVHEDLETGGHVQGVFAYDNTWNDNWETLWVVANGRVFYRVYNSGRLQTSSELTSSSNYSGINLSTSNPIIFEYFREYFSTYCVIADGNGRPVIVTNSGTIYGRSTDYEAPNPCSHVVSLDTYLIGNNVGEQYFDISYPGDFTRWDGDFATAQNRPDDIKAIVTARRKLVLMGSEVCEIWYNDGSTPFAPEYNHIQSGCSAKYSLVNCDNVLYWLDNEKRLVACDIAQSVTPSVISKNINVILSGAYVQLDDCIGAHLRVGGVGRYIANFDNLNRTFCVDLKSGRWNELGHWDTSRGEYKRYPMSAFCTCRALGSIGGSNISDNYYIISDDYDTFDGDEIRTLFRSPTIPSGGRRTFVKKLIISAQRTRDKSDTITVSPEIMVRWRDDGKTNWSAWRTAEITNTGRTNWNIELYRCGSYSDYRQYELVLLGDFPYCINFFGEDVQ